MKEVFWFVVGAVFFCSRDLFTWFKEVVTISFEGTRGFRYREFFFFAFRFRFEICFRFRRFYG